MIQGQCVAIFDTLARAFATLLPMLHTHRNQIFRGEQHLGARRLSPGLYPTSQQSVQAIVQKDVLYVHRPPSEDSFLVPQCACFSANGPSQYVPGWQGGDGDALAGYPRESCSS